jgi:hypothetical protein
MIHFTNTDQSLVPDTMIKYAAYPPEIVEVEKTRQKVVAVEFLVNRLE